MWIDASLHSTRNRLRGLHCIRSTLTFVDLGIKDSDVGQVVVPAFVIQAVADHEHIGDIKAVVVDRHIDRARTTLGQERTDLDRLGAQLAQMLEEPRDRQSGIDDVLDDDDIASLDVGLDVTLDGDLATGLGAFHAGQPDELTLDVDGHVADQVTVETVRSLQDADQDRRLLAPGVDRRQLESQLSYSASDVVIFVEHSRDVVMIDALSHGPDLLKRAKLPVLVYWYKLMELSIIVNFLIKSKSPAVSC